MGLRALHPDIGVEELTSLNNQVLLMIAEYHLMSASQGTHSIAPIVPMEAIRLLPPIEAYLPGDLQGSRDVRLKDQANCRRVATWLHRLDLAATYGRSVAESPDVGGYSMGPLVEYFLAPKTSGLTFEEIAGQVADENCQNTEDSLRGLHLRREELRQEV